MARMMYDVYNIKALNPYVSWTILFLLQLYF